MDPLDHLRDQVAPPGSNLHYCLLFANPHARRVLCAVAAWQQETRRLAFAPWEQSAALARIDWWREEALRLRTGLPRHPITIALGVDSPSPHATAESLLRMVEQVRRLVLDDRVMEEGDLWQHCDALGSEGERMIAQALATPGRGKPPGIVDEVGRGLEMLELIRPPPGHRRITPRMVPRAHDEALDSGPETGSRLSGDSALRDLLRKRGERSERLIREGLRRLEELPRPPERARAVLARLALVHLGVLAREGYRRWESGASPLRRLWTAWRAARRYS